MYFTSYDNAYSVGNRRQFIYIHDDGQMMVGCFPDPDEGLPISVLRGKKYALFTKGTIGKFRHSSETRDNFDDSPYSFLYRYPNQIVSHELKEADIISPRISILIGTPFRCIYIFILLGLFVFFHSKSWSLGALITSNLPSNWALLFGFVAWILIVAWPELLYDYLTKDNDKKKTIEIRHQQRSSPFKLRAKRNEFMELWVLFLTLQKGAAAATLFLHEQTILETLSTNFTLFNSIFLIFGMLAIIFSPLIGIGHMLDLRRGMKSVKEDSIERFFEKLNIAIEKTLEESEKPLDEWISGGENERLELKASFWTNTEGDDKGKQNKELQDVVVKEVAAFLNTLGGTLLIGVKDEEPFLPADTLKADLSHSTNVSTNDELELHISQILERNLVCTGQSLTNCWRIRFIPYRDKTIIRIDVDKAPKHVLAYQPHLQARKGQDKKKMFGFYRQGSRSKEPSYETWSDHITTHW